MQCFSSNKYGRSFFISMDKGEYVLESFRKIIKDNNIRNAVLVSAIGTLDYCVTHAVTTTNYPPVDVFARLEDKPLELSSIQGIVADGVPHFHAIVSDLDRTYSGHLEDGCRVLYLFEAVILEVEGIELTRRLDAHGVNKLALK
jgi:predicted DNA-binding protein with PD1-like motif